MPRERMNFVCSVEGCEKPAHAKGWCRQHWTRMHLYGRLEKIQGLEKGNCKVDGCTNPVKGRGLCNKHYQLNRKYGRTEKLKKNKTIHPFYHLWFERKQKGDLCERWLEFWNFVNDLGERPLGFILIKLDETKLYGPDNFKWSEQIKQKEGENNKEFWSRKWEAARVRNPDIEYDRNLKRNYGISLEEYRILLKFQNNKCAICLNEEVFIFKNGRKKNLAVDHCHNSNKIRELLCWRCNTTLGKIEDSIELLDKMKTYLLKHKEPVL